MLAVVGTQDPMLRYGARDDAARTDTRYDPVQRDDTRWAVADIAIGLVGHIRVEVHEVAKSVGFDAHGNVVFCPRPSHGRDIRPQCLHLRGGHPATYPVCRVDAHHSRGERQPTGEAIRGQLVGDGVDARDDLGALPWGRHHERQDVREDRHCLHGDRHPGDKLYVSRH